MRRLNTDPAPHTSLKFCIPVRFLPAVVSVGLLSLPGLVPLEVPAADTAPTAEVRTQDDKSTESAEEPTKPPKGPIRRRLEERIYGATPEERARLEEERRQLSAAAAGFGTDPTAIIGYHQLEYGHSTFTNNLRLDTVTATVRVPVTPNFGFMINMPYAWADLNRPRGFTQEGTGDMTFRAGGRLYASNNVAVFIGTDGSFPTSSSEKQLGTGKYTIGPGGMVAVPLARVRSLFFLIAEDFRSIGGDPSRADLRFTQITSALNTIWTQRWWSQAIAQWNLDWNNRGKTTLNLQGEIGHRFDDHWNLFVTPGVGVMGRDTFLGLDWTVQIGVRWVYRTPIFGERLFESLPTK